MSEDFPADPAAARRIQDHLRRRVCLTPFDGPVRWVAGLDAAFRGDRLIAAAVLLRFPELTVEAEVAAERPVPMAYVPGLLSFREGPAALAALDGLPRTPDLLLVDGQGIAHPRRLGIASHVGVLRDLPAVGVAKSRLTGEPVPDAEALDPRRGRWLPLVDGEEVVGALVRSRERVRPLYVSPGHRTTIAGSVAWTLACGSGFRLPEPTRAADAAAARHKRADGASAETEQGA